MKKMIHLLLTAFLLAACEKDPDVHELDDKYLVYTDYDTDIDFSAFHTYYLPDSILLMSNKLAPDYWTDNNALNIINAYADNMTALGYTRTEHREDAELGLQISYVANRYQVTSVGSPAWWWGYPGYWDIAYWGNWGYWYYPYTISYGFSTGSFITELLDLKAPQGDEKQLPIIWSNYLTGILSVSQTYDNQRAIEGVNQAFAQSPYLQRP